MSSPDAKPGGYAKLVFRVPTESDSARTTKLVVSLPKDHPFAPVGAQVKDGWTVEKTTEKLAAPVKVGDVTLSQAITTVTWTAVAGGIPANDTLGAAGLLLGLIGLGLGVRSRKTRPQSAAIPTGSASAASAPASSASARRELAGPGRAGSGEFGKAQS